jgi:hypothetical protein
MANISLGTLSTYWKNISDWVKGTDTVSAPKIVAEITSGKAVGFEAVIINDTVGGVALTSAKYGTCTKAIIQVQDAPIRYWTTGGSPTSTIGILAQVGAVIYLDNTDDIANFKAIRATSTNANLACQYSN